MSAVTLTSLPLPWEARARLLDFGGILEPPLGGASQRFSRLGSRFEVDFSALPALPEPYASALIAARLNARSSGSTVICPFPQTPVPNSTLLGTPAVNGANQTGSTLITNGWTYTNRLLWSEDLSQTWTASAVTVTTNAAAIFDGAGAHTLDFVAETTANSAHTILQAATITANNPVTASFDIAPDGRQWVRITLGNAGATNQAQVDFNCLTGAHSAITLAGTTSGASFSVSPLPRGGFRVALTCTIDNATTSAQLKLFICSAQGTTSYAGDGVSGVYAGRFQLEQAAAASAYRKTTTGQVGLPAGRFFSFVDAGGRNYLHQLSADGLVNSSGQSTLSIAPLLRVSPPDTNTLNVTAPKIEGFIAGQSEDWTLTMLTVTGLPAFTIREAV